MHIFDPNIAAEYGIAEAVIIQHFQFWIKTNKRNGTNENDGRTWTYHTAKALAETFPYLSEKQVWLAINKLVEKGVLMKGNYNKTQYDRTTWYAFTLESFWITPEGDFHFPKRENPTPRNGEPIPDTSTDKKTDNTFAPKREGIKKKKSGKREEEKPPRAHWQPFVDTWHGFYVAHVKGEAPSILGRRLTELGQLYDLLQLRAKKKMKEWTEAQVVESLTFFLTLAWSEDWLQKHFLLKNLIEQFDAVYAREVARMELENKNKPKTLKADLAYIVERHKEGLLDERLLTPDIYKLLEEQRLVPIGYREKFTAATPELQKAEAIKAWLKAQNPS